jgi:hypothetical protein
MWDQYQAAVRCICQDRLRNIQELSTYRTQTRVGKCDICSYKFEEPCVAIGLVFIDGLHIRQRLDGGRDEWDDLRKAVSKLSSIPDGKE